MSDIEMTYNRKPDEPQVNILEAGLTGKIELRLELDPVVKQSRNKKPCTAQFRTAFRVTEVGFKGLIRVVKSHIGLNAAADHVLEFFIGRNKHQPISKIDPHLIVSFLQLPFDRTQAALRIVGIRLAIRRQ